MAIDFETTAAETVTKLQDLMNRADEAEENLSQAREQINQVTEQFETN
ncbi:hypothetical protein IQ238_22875 [Pleurocapsales cyanobacterium LEGE 06147]|nr:hypothetical protein [Pleurocapsales cyanobacterium LEGE 06147]